MTDEPNPALNDILEDHDERIISLEKWRDGVGDQLDDIRQKLSAFQATGQAQYASVTAASDRQSRDLQELTRQLAESTGAQKERNRLDQNNLTNAKIAESKWKKRSAIFAIVFTAFGAIGGTILSSQTWDDYFFSDVPFLHRKRHAQPPEQDKTKP